MVQWIERGPAKAEIAGSTPAGRTWIFKCLFLKFLELELLPSKN